MKSTQKELVLYGLYRYIAQLPNDIALQNDLPGASVRRVLQELVTAGRAKFTRKDLFGDSGYVYVSQPRRARRAS